MFLIKTKELVKCNGTYSWIIPNKFLIADYAKKTKNSLIKDAGLLYSINVSLFNVFEGINVYPIIIFGNKKYKDSFNSFLLEKYSDLSKRRFIKPKELKKHSLFKELNIRVSSGATGFQAEQLKKSVFNFYFNGCIPFIVSGNVDRYKWSNKLVRYMGDSYSTAYVNNNDESIAKSKWNFWSNPKIIIAGMTKVIEAVYVEEPLGLGVGIYGIYDFGDFDPWCLTAILNSKYLSHYFLIKFKDKHLAGGYLAINKSTIENFPITKINPLTQSVISNISKKIHQLTALDKDTTTLEQQIDNLVYRLYNITYDEVKVIDSEFGLSREEYEGIVLE